MSDNLMFRTAEKHLKEFQAESDDLMQRHREAMDSWDREAFLQIGIDAFEWLVRLDQVIRAAIARGERQFDPNCERAIHLLCQGFLKTASHASEWALASGKSGHKIERLAKFDHCVEEMQAIFQSQEEGAAEELPASMATLQNQALEDHRNGETAEFVP